MIVIMITSTATVTSISTSVTPRRRLRSDIVAERSVHVRTCALGGGAWSVGRVRSLTTARLAAGRCVIEYSTHPTSLWAKEAENRLAAFEAGQTKEFSGDEVFQEFC